MNYEMRNRGLGNMFVQAIAEHPDNPDVILLGTQGGVYKTTDRGRTWVAKRTGFPPASQSAHSVQISKIAFDPRVADVVLAAVGQPRLRRGARGEIWRSEDCGETWRMIVRSGLSEDLNVFDLSLDPRDGRRMLLSSDAGVFASDDGGANWEPSSSGLPVHRRTRFLARSARDPDVVYVTLRQKGGETPWAAGVYRSSDGGRTWEERSGGLRRLSGKEGCNDNLCTWTDVLAVSAEDSDSVWTGGASWWYPGIYRTSDGGRNWNGVFPSPPPGWIDFWGACATCLAVSPVDSRRLAFGTAGAVFVTDDGGETWRQRYSSDRNDSRLSGTGLEVTCLHAITPSRFRRGRFYHGYFDIGLLVTDDFGRTFRRCMKGVPKRFSNSCFCLTEAPDNPRVLWAGFGDWAGRGSGCIARSEDGGESWMPCTNAANGWVDVPARDLISLGSESRYRVLGADALGLFMSTDGGTTWRRSFPGFPEASRVRALAQSAGKVYAAVDGSADGPSGVFVSDGDLASWRLLTSGFVQIGTVRHLAAEGDRILLTTRAEPNASGCGSRPGGAWLSADGGRTWKLSYRDRFADAALICGGELYVSLGDHPYHDLSAGGGVIHSKDEGATWTYLDGSGLANWNVTSLAMDPFDRRTLWIGTRGNSVFVQKTRSKLK